MASPHARQARISNSGVSRRHGKRNLSGTITLALLAAAFVGVAAVLIFAFRTSGGESPKTPVNGAAPDFTLPSVDGQSLTLSSFRGKSNVLLFFNEGYGCAPCWQQTLELQQREADLQAADTVLVPIMVDSPSQLKGEIDRWRLTVPIFTDTSRDVSQSYNALGGMHADKPNHTFVLVDKAGQIRWWQDYASMQAPTGDVIQKVQSVNSAEQ